MNMIRWYARLSKELKVLQPQFQERFMQALLQELNVAKRNFPDLKDCSFRRDSFDAINMAYPLQVKPTSRTSLRTGAPYQSPLVPPKPPNKKDLQELMKISMKNAFRSAMGTIER